MGALVCAAALFVFVSSVSAWTDGGKTKTRCKAH